MPRALEAQAQLAQFKAPRTMTEAQARHFIGEVSKYSGTQADIWIIGDDLPLKYSSTRS